MQHPEPVHSDSRLSRQQSAEEESEPATLVRWPVERAPASLWAAWALLAVQMREPRRPDPSPQVQRPATRSEGSSCATSEYSFPRDALNRPRDASQLKPSGRLSKELP